MTEVTLDEFTRALDREFAFLIEEQGFDSPYIWQFAGDLYAVWEGPDAVVSMMCGRRVSDIDTYVERLSIGRGLYLRTSHSVLREPEAYPPTMGAPWDANGFANRIQLERRVLERQVSELFGSDVQLFAEYGGEVTPEFARLDDAAATFPRRCLLRFAFLAEEYGLHPELEEMGSSVVYVGEDQAVRLNLLYSWYEQDGEHLEAELFVQLLRVVNGLVSPYPDGEDLEVEERVGPFTSDYLERAFDDAERKIRERLR